MQTSCNRFLPMLVGLLCLAPVHVAAATPTAASDVRPLLVGSPVPDVPLVAADGTTVSLHAALGDRPAVVIFYRGGW